MSSLEFKLACWDFRRNRGDFYIDLASSMKAAKEINIIKILERYALRYSKESVGILCAHWVENMHHTGSFHAAIRGSIPDEDVALIAASENHAEFPSALKLLGKNIIALKKVQAESWQSLAAAVVLLVILHVYLGIMSFMVLSKMEAVMSKGADISKFGLMSDILFGSANFIQNFWWMWLAFVASFVALVIWALPNYIGKYRRFLDNHFFLFQIYRDFVGVSFLTAISALTGGMGAQLLQLNDAFTAIRSRSSVPWLNWQIDMIQANLKMNPNSKGEIFETGITSKRIYFRILDLADYQAMEIMLGKVGDIILEVAPVEARTRALKIRFSIMIFCMSLILGSWVGTGTITDAYKRQVQLRTMR